MMTPEEMGAEEAQDNAGFEVKKTKTTPAEDYRSSSVFLSRSSPSVLSFSLP